MVTGLAVADDQCQLSARRARLGQLAVGLDVEFKDETERRRAQPDDRLRLSGKVRRRVVQQQNCIAHQRNRRSVVSRRHVTRLT